MRYAMTLILLAAAILLTACNTDQRKLALDAAQVSAALLTVNSQFDLAVAQIDRSIFTAAELARLDQSIDDLRQLQVSLRTLITQHGGVGQLLLNVAQASAYFETGKRAYLDGKAVIIPHLRELSLSDQQLLGDMDRSARRIDTALQSLTTATDGTDITPYVRDALLIAHGVATLAAGL